MYPSAPQPLEISIPFALRRREFAPQLSNLGVQMAGVDGHLDALVLGLGQLRAELRELDGQFEDGDLWRGNGDLHRLRPGGRPEREAGFRRRSLTESYLDRLKAPLDLNPLERWRHILWTASAADHPRWVHRPDP